MDEMNEFIATKEEVQAQEARAAEEYQSKADALAQSRGYRDHAHEIDINKAATGKAFREMLVRNGEAGIIEVGK